MHGFDCRLLFGTIFMNMQNHSRIWMRCIRMLNQLMRWKSYSSRYSHIAILVMGSICWLFQGNMQGTALRICLLLLDVALLSHHASRSAVRPVFFLLQIWFFSLMLLCVVVWLDTINWLIATFGGISPDYEFIYYMGIFCVQLCQSSSH